MQKAEHVSLVRVSERYLREEQCIDIGDDTFSVKGLIVALMRAKVQGLSCQSARYIARAWHAQVC